MTPICEVCEKPFEAKTSRKKCCSQKCYKIRLGFYMPNQELKTNICLKCDRPFETLDDSRTCPECRIQNNRIASCYHDAAIYDGDIPI